MASKLIPSGLFLVAMLVVTVVIAAEAPIPQGARESFAAIVAHEKVKNALDFLKKDDANTLAEQKAIVVIPAPPFKEQARAADYVKRLGALGL